MSKPAAFALIALISGSFTLPALRAFWLHRNDPADPADDDHRSVEHSQQPSPTTFKGA